MVKVHGTGMPICRTMPLSLGYVEVKIEVNDGPVFGHCVCAWSKRRPSLASRSMFGEVLRA